MKLARPLTAIATIVVAVVVAVAVPAAQLRLFSVVASCCCPNPASCHCPGHTADHCTRSSMRACHRTSSESVTPPAPELVAPAIAVIDALPRAIAVTVIAIPAAHAPPDARRPAAPS